MDDFDDFDLSEFLPYLLNQAAEAASRDFQRLYRERYGMLRTEWRVLFHLGRYGPISAQEIGRMASLHKTKVSRAVAALEKRRFLTRERVEEDRRRERLSLTAAGRAAFDDLRDQARRYNAGLSADFAPEDWQALVSSLRRIARMDGD